MRRWDWCCGCWNLYHSRNLQRLQSVTAQNTVVLDPANQYLLMRLTWFNLDQSGSIWSIMTTSFYMSKLLALPRMHIKNDTSLTRRCLLKSLAGTIAGQSKVIACRHNSRPKQSYCLFGMAFMAFAYMVWLCKAHLSCLQTSGRRKGARRSRARACCNCNFCNFCNFTRCRCSRCSRCSRCRFDRFDWRACRRGRAGDVWASLRTAKA